MEFKQFQNLHAILEDTAAQSPDKKAFSWFTSAGQTESVSWQQFHEQVRNAAKSLIALGVKKGDKINIISYTSYKWVLLDQAITAIGACTVGIYQTNLARDCGYIINHSDAVLVFLENLTQLDKVFQIREGTPHVREVILMNGDYKGNDWIMNFNDFLSLGRRIPDMKLDAMIGAVHPDDLAAIVYTSGTTGIPKGAMLDHGSVTFASQSAAMSGDFRRADETFVFLPMAHIFARIQIYVPILLSIHVTFARSMDAVVDDIRVARPDYICCVPRIFEKVYAKVLSGAEAKGGAALRIFRWACSVGYEVSDRNLAHVKISPWLGLKYALAERTVFSKIRDALGGRIRFCISGAAPLDPSIARFFYAAGILILEGFGMTENMSFSHVNRIDNFHFGRVGMPGPGIEQKINGDGEILIRGRNVMKGYYKMPDETAEVITADGWLRTGDLGELDSHGSLRITGRKKDLIITSGGKNIAPSAIEGRMVSSRYIKQFCVIGDRRNYLTALATLNVENVKGYADRKGISFESMNDLIKNRTIIALVKAEVEVMNGSLAPFESVKRVTIVPEFTIDNGMLTPTLKLKKNIILDCYRAEIDSMYAAGEAVPKKSLAERRTLPDRRISPPRNPVDLGFSDRRIMQRRASVAI